MSKGVQIFSSRGEVGWAGTLPQAFEALRFRSWFPASDGPYRLRFATDGGDTVELAAWTWTLGNIFNVEVTEVARAAEGLP